jgi:hypothetical protein
VNLKFDHSPPLLIDDDESLGWMKVLCQPIAEMLDDDLRLTEMIKLGRQLTEEVEDLRGQLRAYHDSPSYFCQQRVMQRANAAHALFLGLKRWQERTAITVPADLLEGMREYESANEELKGRGLQSPRVGGRSRQAGSQV